MKQPNYSAKAPQAFCLLGARIGLGPASKASAQMKPLTKQDGNKQAFNCTEEFWQNTEDEKMK